jgi:hypothetical protein
MERFETESLALLPGQRVQAKILSHHSWGVVAEIVGYERVGASVDMIQQFGSATSSYDELKAMYPPVGSQIDAVVEQVDRYDPPGWVRLSIHPEDMESFRWICDFCGKPTVLSPGGDGLALDVRSNDGPGSHTVISHRTCLADRIRPENSGERAGHSRSESVTADGNGDGNTGEHHRTQTIVNRRASTFWVDRTDEDEAGGSNPPRPTRQDPCP